jgi:hypothetical protein
MLCSLVEKHKCVTKTFASTRAEVQGSRPICNGASLPNYAMLQPTRHWLSLICLLEPKSLRSQTTVCIHRQWPQGHSSALRMAFCLCCLWTSTLYPMAILLLLFTQQYVLWATQFSGFLCGVMCGKVCMYVVWDVLCSVCGTYSASVHGRLCVCVEQFVGCGVLRSVRWSVWCCVRCVCVHV